MKPVTIATALLLHFSLTQAFTPKPHVTCSRSWVKVGCFHDSLSPRPFPYELINDRDIFSNHSDGHLIDWRKWKESMHSLACRCAEKARASGYRMFGLQFYGECWSGPSAELRYSNDGPSENCFQQLIKPYTCVKSDPVECVGGAKTNYVYMLTDNTPPSQDLYVDGGYTTWSGWSGCSKTCGDGEKSRERTCTNPTPKGHGRPCEPRLGPSTETVQCRLVNCPPKCKRVLDVGIVVDSSASVHRENFFKVKEFLDKLVSELEIGPSKSHVGLVRYNEVADTLWDFNGAENNNLKSLKDAIEKIEYLPGGTRTDLALKKVNEDIFSPMGGARKDVPQVLVVITDGKTNQRSEPYSSVLQPLKDKDVKIVAVGVGHSIGKKELDIIALGDASNVFMLETFDDLVRRLNAIMNSFCDTLST
ncbi:coadhesin [Nematostella vectensis]|uniref:coadhesin n=1 Tax=Nematostella vectensis TaxID=45351 RepID=UPI002076E7CA|nr:coadhesin [Nematostella vectensis]XP_032235490.2 coadhesin [Nematostella vectensis]XP_032235491.2 coadhesin [Nematostella vectensis]XP_032235492.2 coadhesin [Nematostella vectensis]